MFFLCYNLVIFLLEEKKVLAMFRIPVQTLSRKSTSLFQAPSRLIFMIKKIKQVKLCVIFTKICLTFYFLNEVPSVMICCRRKTVLTIFGHLITPYLFSNALYITGNCPEGCFPTLTVRSLFINRLFQNLLVQFAK